MAWKISGRMIESCSCNMLCPCFFGVPELMVMDQGWCDSAILFEIADGDADGVALAGRRVALGIDFPGPTMFDGNATARIYIDDAASAEQARELEAIFHGEKAGPMSILAPLISRWLDTQSTTITSEEDGDRIAVTVGNAGRVENRVVRDQQGHDFELRGGGFIAALGLEAAQAAPSSSRWSDPDLPRTFETKSGVRGNFNWSD